MGGIPPRTALVVTHTVGRMATTHAKRLVRRAVVFYSVRNRHRKAAVISAFMRERGASTVLFVGVGTDRQPNETIVERAIAACGVAVAACDVTTDYPGGLPYVQGDGRALPFRSGSVDVVISNAVIEHVGGTEDQRRFVLEHLRVGRTWVMTTPNKWFPVESHTSTVFRHWLPSWRFGRTEFTRLMSLREFRALLPEGTKVLGDWWSPTFMALGSHH